MDTIMPLFTDVDQRVLVEGIAPYLSGPVGGKHRFCNNAEGWGPLSLFRNDFTPCFIDACVAAAASFGVVLGALALWWLARKPSTGLAKDGVFWAKQMLLGLVLADVAVQAGLQVLRYRDAWFSDVRFLSTFLLLASLAVIFAVQWTEHGRLRHACGVALLYWVFLLVVLCVKLRSLVSQQQYVAGPADVDTAYLATFATGVGLAVLAFGVEWLGPRKKSAVVLLDDDEDDEEEPCPAEDATVFSRLTFSWMTPLMRLGYRQYLTEDALWGLVPEDRTSHTSASFSRAWTHGLGKSERPSLWRVVARAYGGPYAVAALFKIGNDLAAFAQPQLLRLLISFVASYQTVAPAPAMQGASIAFAMFAVATFQTLMIHQYFQTVFTTGMHIKGGLTAAIYRKSLTLSHEGRAARTTGDIVNYMAVDVQRLQDLTQYLHQLWSAPFQIIICMVSLYQLVGWSMLSGISIMIIMVPVNGLMARYMKGLQKQQMKYKDARSRLIAEIVNNMKSIKLFAWGAAFSNRLNYVRNDLELRNLRRIGATQSLTNFTWTTTPFLVSCTTFATFVLTHDEPLTTGTIFPALALFNLLTFPLAVLPMVITSLVEASVAVARLTDFLTAPEIQPDAVELRPAVDELGDEAVGIRDGSFAWSRHADPNAGPEHVLRHIDFSADKGSLTCVVGRVGAGKSSLLQALLGNLYKAAGDVQVSGSVAYVAQQSWIMNTTVRENIVFGHRFDASFYEQTISACALLDDFAQLPDGDETVVGERGIALSGGQKARVSLARAVYARADVYLLDDCLSAVDAHVGRHLIDQVLGPSGLLRSKARILATNAIPVLAVSDAIYLLRDGAIVEHGTYRQLVAMRGLVSDLIRTASQTSGSSLEPLSEQSEPSEPSEPSSGPSSSETSTVAGDDADETTVQSIHGGKRQLRKRRPSTTTLRRASAASFRGPRGKLTDDEAGGPKTRQALEHAEQGQVRWHVYSEYAKTNNVLAVTIYMVALLASQTASIGSGVWLKVWSDHNANAGTNAQIGRYIGIYFVFGIGAALLAMGQTLVLWIFCSIEASRKLHERMAAALFRAPMSFFDTTPAGRILNRFSSDIYRVDEVLARTFNMLFVNAARSGFTLALISATTPAFVALIVPLACMYILIQRYYLYTSRELKRLDSVSKSPIYAHFQESLGGLATIRAFRQQPRFERENAWRTDANLRAYFPSVSANRWLAVRLEFIGAVVILGASGLAVTAVVIHQRLDPGMVGLAMSYALQITTSLNWIVRQSVEVETNIVSVERVLEYAALPSEAPEIVPRHRPPVSWPAHGAVAFHGYSTRYRAGLDLVLKNIHLDIRPHDKIGVVGRTGAGKSSLTLALFRIIEPASGHISIDGLNTSTIGLLDLRRRLAIIPQDAALFEGTVRDNLDPAHVHDDTELWTVLEHACLKDHIASMAGGLEAAIQEGGTNLSQGQRQLVSLARALLTPSSILVLDEATAAVDVETDRLLQQTLRSPLFSNRTIITVAHRINTILDSDRVVVLDKGEVAEFGAPQDLITQRGIFYGLVKQAGLTE